MASIRFKHGSYHVLFRDRHGVQHSESCGPHETHAKKRRAEIELELYAGRNPADSNLLFASAWAEWRTHKLHSSRPIARSTLADYDSIYRCYLEPLFAKSRLRDMHAKAMAGMQVSLRQDGVSAVRLGKVIVPLRACLRWHSRSGAYPYDTSLLFDTPAPPADERKALTFEEAERLIAEIPEHYRAFISCAVFTGLRLGELRALTWRDVDLHTGIIHVRRSMDGGVVRPYTKTLGTRSVGLPTHLAAELRVWRAECPYSPDGIVFPEPSGRRIDADNFRKRSFKPALARAGIDRGFRMHDLRHTAASWYLRSGATVADLMGIFGWRQLQTALRYVHMLETPTFLADRLSASRDASLTNRQVG